MAENRPEKILKILRRTFTLPKWTTSNDDPFKTLIVTIISQNTADKNTERAFENLSNRFKIVPEVLANAATSQVEGCLKVGGLYRNKAKAIKQTSKILLEKYDGNLNRILESAQRQRMLSSSSAHKNPRYLLTLT
jgi:endonuclease-3